MENPEEACAFELQGTWYKGFWRKVICLNAKIETMSCKASWSKNNTTLQPETFYLHRNQVKG